jgi:hypothetical protein
MTLEQKITTIKKLEALVAFQKECLNIGNWDDYDKAENKIKTLENEIIYQSEV